MSSEIVMQKHQIPDAQNEKRDVSEMMIYWRGVTKRKWAILGVSVALAVLAALASLMITPVYRATATVMIEQNRARVVAIEEVYSGGGASREHFETQADILASRALASKVIAKLGLTTHPEFDPRQQKPPVWRTIAQRMGVTFEQKEVTGQQIDAAVLGSFMQRTIVEPGRLTQLIRVSFDSADPELAAHVANAIVDTYIESDTETRYGMTRRATDWLQERLSGLKTTLEQSERALQDYREREHIVETRGLAQSGAPRQIEDLTRALVEARQKRTQAEIAYEQTKIARGNPESLSVIQRSPLMVGLKDAESDAERKVAELSKRYGPEHVRMIQAQSELRQARESTQKQISTILASLANEYQAARANEKALERSLAEAKAQVQGMNRKEFRLVSLERAVAANRQIYETFLNRFKETSTQNGVQSNRVARITDPALPPDTPIKPKKRFIVTIFFVLAVFFGMLVAVLRERLDNTLKAPDDVEDKLGQPMLAMLPLLRGDSSKHTGRHFLSESRSPFSEGIRTVRTGVLLSGLSAPQKALLVTSSVADEGKTVVAANLALAHAQTQRVLLVDADLHQPSVATQLALDRTKPGLTDLFSGAANFADCLQRVPGSSLYVLSAGSTQLDPLEVMLSQRFQQLLKALTNACDLVIIDSPPMHLFSDALLLANMVNGVVFVVKAGSTPHPLARHSLGALRSVNAKVLGVILNQLDFREAERYYGAYTSGYDDYYRKPSKLWALGRRLAHPPAEPRIITASKIH